MSSFLPEKLFTKYTLTAFFLVCALGALVIGFTFQRQIKSAIDQIVPICDFEYVAYNTISQEDLIHKDIDTLEKSFSDLRKMRVQTVIQPFSDETSKDEWGWFLDVAKRNEFKVIPIFLPGQETIPVLRNGNFSLGKIGQFLDLYRQHSALYAIGVLEYPYHPTKYQGQMTQESIQLLYKQIKQLAPSVPVYVNFGLLGADAVYLGEPIKNAMCDICAIGDSQFKLTDQGNTYEKDVFMSTNFSVRHALSKNSSNSKLWVNAQTFGATQSYYFMPSPDELEDVVRLALSPGFQSEYPLSAVVFQYWAPLYDTESEVGQMTLNGDSQRPHREMLLGLYSQIQSSCSKKLNF